MVTEKNFFVTTLKQHSIHDWYDFRDEIEIKVSDGSIEVMTMGEQFMLLEDTNEVLGSTITKNELKALLVSGAYESGGILTVEGVVD